MLPLISPLPALSLNSPPSTPNFPYLPLQTYFLISLSGALACALTHLTVVPLDVLKTLRQTSSSSKPSLFSGSLPTVLGYSFYGLTVYPTYNLLLRYLPTIFIHLTPQDSSLISGALAACVACVGLAPMEAIRIRTVSDPLTYENLNIKDRAILAGGTKELYRGLPPLLIRQVCFGTVKFAAFEYLLSVVLESEVFGWTERGGWVASLAAGVGAGLVGSIVSQPADAVLTWLGGGEGEREDLVGGMMEMLEKRGVKSLTKGGGERLAWAGFIIGAQFALYDEIRGRAGVGEEGIKQAVAEAMKVKEAVGGTGIGGPF
ncbi:hypothetical protein TrCOL_g4398 [Triparma columacea]|uniref:Mitochondrial carrier protein n=1 Tax=Triparma columacea TaxID=722753 RepID=A0A9W7GI62_9STRA|nr:hypothetical protein TrCOL_g4398 [Triparma columacea]